MKLYFAPMEGITGYVFRNAYHSCYSGIDTYFTPFISNPVPNQIERHDALPENNPGLRLVPQIIANRVDVFIAIATWLKELGYSEVNFNLGCPSGTVVAKGRGSGLLREPRELRRVLDGIFEASPLPVSVKCRIGLTSEVEWEDILSVLLEFPLKELIIHPRTQKDFYKGELHMDAFRMAYERVPENIPLCYNGDVFTTEAFLRIKNEFPKLSAVMLGRGILQNPELPEKLTGLMKQEEAGEPLSPGLFIAHPDHAGVTRLRQFLDQLLQGYQGEMNREGPALAKLKELWAYLQVYTQSTPKDLRPLWKAKTLAEYRDIVTMLLQKC